MGLSVSWRIGLDLKNFCLLAEMLSGKKIQWGKLKDASVRQEESALQLQEENNLPRQQLCREGPGDGLITRKTRSQLHHGIAENQCSTDTNTLS